MELLKTADFSLYVYNNEEQRTLLNEISVNLDHVINALYAYGCADKINEFLDSYLNTSEKTWGYISDWTISIQYMGVKDYECC